jgi:FkbM family methyltransferase
MKTFVEIGSSYFNTLRELCDKGWKGVMVDPLEIALNKVPDHDNLIKVTGAIDVDFSVKKLTKVKDEYWDNIHDTDYLGMASIGVNAPIKKAKPEYIEEIDVACVPFNFLMEQLNITKIDYLKIDTEGLDFDILKSIDFNSININLIKVEHEHIPDQGYTLKEMVDFLKENNYIVEIFETDIVAIKA